MQSASMRENFKVMEAKRHTARMDYAFRALNGGNLPMFHGSWSYPSRAGSTINVVSGEIPLCPMDATPETALELLQRYMKNSGHSLDGAVLHVRLEEQSAAGLIRAVPAFYQGASYWTRSARE